MINIDLRAVYWWKRAYYFIASTCNYKSHLVFSSDKPYSCYVHELTAYKCVTDLPKEKQLLVMTI